MDELKQLIKQFMPFAQQKMGFERPPRLFLRQDDQNGADPLGKTGFYDPQAESITLFVSARHPKDILRSLAHELMHHTQKCNGDFDNEESQGMGEQGYAQSNTHMRNMEIEAYQASIVFRDWEDSLKETIYYEHLQKGATKTMSTKSTKEWKNGELSTLLSEAWGFKFNSLQEFNEFNGTGEIQEVSTEDPDIGKKETEGEASDKWEKEDLETEGKDWGHGKDEDERSEDEEGHESEVDSGDKDKDYTWRKGKKSKSHRGVNKEGKSLTEKSKRHSPNNDSRSQGGRRLKEDSGEEQAWDDWKNEHADDDHIREMEHHLRALKEDRDHESHGAEYDDDKYEDEGYDRHEEGLKRKLSEKQLRRIALGVAKRLKGVKTNG